MVIVNDYNLCNKIPNLSSVIGSLVFHPPPVVDIFIISLLWIVKVRVTCSMVLDICNHEIQYCHMNVKVRSNVI